MVPLRIGQKISVRVCRDSAESIAGQVLINIERLQRQIRKSRVKTQACIKDERFTFGVILGGFTIFVEQPNSTPNIVAESGTFELK